MLIWPCNPAGVPATPSPQRRYTVKDRQNQDNQSQNQNRTQGQITIGAVTHR